jgi:putative transposase
VSVVRTDTLRLLATPEIDEFLQRVGDATAKLINMENYRRRQLFFSTGKIDYSWQSAWARRFTDYFDIYKLLGSKNFHEACRVIGEQWRSFVGLLKAAKEGELEPWQKVRPPGYRKRDGQRVPIVVVRFDNYRVDLERGVLRLGYWNIEVPFTGKPRWLTRSEAKQGRLIITYDPVKKRWYARVSVEVVLERKCNGGLKAGIDLGRERLIALVTEPLGESGEGVALLYRGGPLKSDYFYFEKKIAKIDRDAGRSQARGNGQGCPERDSEALLREEEAAEGPVVRERGGALGQSVPRAQRERRVHRRLARDCARQAGEGEHERVELPGAGAEVGGHAREPWDRSLRNTRG